MSTCFTMIGAGGGLTVLHLQESKQLFKEISRKVKIWCLGRVVVPRFRESQTVTKKTNGSKSFMNCWLRVFGGMFREYGGTDVGHLLSYCMNHLLFNDIFWSNYSDLTRPGQNPRLFQGNLGGWNIIPFGQIQWTSWKLHTVKLGMDRMDMDAIRCRNIPWHWWFGDISFQGPCLKFWKRRFQHCGYIAKLVTPKKSGIGWL